MYYFRNGGEEEILLGSADLMPRNLDGRVETLFPVEDESLKAAIRDEILALHLADTAQSHQLLENGMYARIAPLEGAAPVSSQEQLIQSPGRWHQEDPRAE